MPFSSQPPKKSVTKKPQDGKKPSCGHVSRVKDCAQCNPANLRVANAAEEKKQLASLYEKVLHQFACDSKAFDKAAFVLNSWISKKKK